MDFTVHSIGCVHAGEDGFSIKLCDRFAPALAGLEGFGWVQVIWWFHLADNPATRETLIETKPYVNGPDALGVFATRSPRRPNPIAVSPAYVTGIDREGGTIRLAWIDAADGTPVLDIKPYTPSVDRVEDPAVPKWCSHWPKCVEDSGEFDWESEFNF